ncbi:GPO family capsid scaffolding protein [Cellvibrio sp. QJXJ]|uniref:GPO family capsid scaffolding protein n=1 Tax=Cellvibrio sp. QJXJ TaxID=2964606 RepID=UPI0021C3ED5B|nr:GPO family capsid scaffolding protein [Cellvibrio sp. QJXJ]UUA73085.1 GPO family capsid scaffolding protein [Cellvibrio sp. QJXJ]
MYIVQNANILQSLAEQALNNFSIFNSLDVDCMARNLKTGWVIVATSGETTDGRKIEKKWLEDMAANYSERLYSAKIWPNHERYYGSQGKVLALKVEPATDPQLKGEVHLMAILAPSENLVYANQQGRLVHTSIEVLKNFANRGFFYLGGLAVTDNPASLGTTELQFSDEAEKFHIQGDALDLSSAEEKGFFDFFRNKKPTDTDQEPEPMSKELLEKIIDGQTKMVEAFTVMGEHLKALKTAPEEKPNNDGKDKPTDKTDGDDFDIKKAFGELTEKFTKLSTDFEEAKKNPVPGTAPAGDDAGAQSGVIC